MLTLIAVSCKHIQIKATTVCIELRHILIQLTFFGIFIMHLLRVTVSEKLGAGHAKLKVAGSKPIMADYFNFLSSKVVNQFTLVTQLLLTFFNSFKGGKAFICSMNNYTL